MNKAMNRDSVCRIYRPSAILGYELVPNSGPDVNCFGMIGKEHRLKKDKDTYRILVLGDSITEANGYVEMLEKQLNYSKPRLEYNFEIWNAGVGAYQVDQYANYLRHRGLKYNPDMLVIGFCLNDFEPLYYVYYKDENGFTLFYNPTYEVSRILPLNRYFFRHSYIYRFLIVNLNNVLSNSRVKFPKNPNRKQEGLYYLRIIKDICQKKNIPILGVIFPYFKPLTEYKDYERERHKEMTSVLQSLNIDFLDLDEYFPEESRRSLREDKDDCIHPSSEGHAIAAMAIYNYLLENYFDVL